MTLTDEPDVIEKPQNIDTKDECVDTKAKKVTVDDIQRLLYKRGIWEKRGGIFD